MSTSGTDDQQYNCGAQVCCDDGHHDMPKRLQALTSLMVKALGQGPYEPIVVARWIDDTFDLAGKGTLYAFKQWVVAMVKAGPFME